MSFNMRLASGRTYACAAGTMVHAFNGWKGHEVDKVCVELMDEVGEKCTSLGLTLVPNAS